MASLLELTPEDFVDALRGEGQQRAYFVFDSSSQQMHVSHRSLQEIGDFFVSDARDFLQHEAVFLQIGPETGALFGAFIHCTRRGQAQGGLRHWPYPNLEAYLRDGLRLAVGMGRKASLAGLWWGGGKGVIARQSDEQSGEQFRDPEYRKLLYGEYGDFVSSLHGAYLTAEDAGTTPHDMATVYQHTRFMSCAPIRVGGSGNPSISTAAGVVGAQEAALDFLGRGTLKDKRIAMQGTGNVGSAMIGMLLEKGVRSIIASELSLDARAALLDCYADAPLEVRLVEPGDVSILAEPCDILVPNALGGVLNPETIPKIEARIVCGSANNQLLDDARDGLGLLEHGITYVPDFVANRMGIVNCGNEQYGRLSGDPAIERHLGREWENSIHVVTQRVLERSQREGITPVEAANRGADEAMRELHPIWEHRAWDIIQSLVRDEWHQAGTL